MRTIEDKILNKLRSDVKGVYQLSCRDRVNIDDTVKEYYLWHNRIYFIRKGVEHFCFCNWSSVTTKSRLNALVKAGYFFQKNWKIYFKMRSTNKTYPIDTSKTYAIDNIGGFLLERGSHDDYNTYNTVEEVEVK